MIDVGISYGFDDDSRYNLEDIPSDIQLAIFKYPLYLKNRDHIIEALSKAGTKVCTVHLPLDVMHHDIKDIFEMTDLFNKEFNCQHFIVHPNKGIKNFIDKFLEYMNAQEDYYKLCIETFQWRKKKRIRSPLDIMEYCILHPQLTMCIDTSHIETLWFDPMIMSTLLKHTDVIHLSNRAKGYGSHMPFNSPHGQLNLVRFVKDLKNRYKWNGCIILEYMTEHQNKLLKNYYYIKKLVE